MDCTLQRYLIQKRRYVNHAILIELEFKNIDKKTQLESEIRAKRLLSRVTRHLPENLYIVGLNSEEINKDLLIDLPETTPHIIIENTEEYFQTPNAKHSKTITKQIEQIAKEELQ